MVSFSFAQPMIVSSDGSFATVLPGSNSRSRPLELHSEIVPDLVKYLLPAQAPQRYHHKNADRWDCCDSRSAGRTAHDRGGRLALRPANARAGEDCGVVLEHVDVALQRVGHAKRLAGVGVNVGVVVVVVAAEIVLHAVAAVDEEVVVRVVEARAWRSSSQLAIATKQ